MREEQPNTQGDWEERGEKTAIFNSKQLKDAKIPLFGDRPKPQNSSDDVKYLTAKNGTFTSSPDGIEFTFRGATLQTSGHRDNWEYAFSYTPQKNEPSWLSDLARDYEKNFKGPAKPDNNKPAFGDPPAKPEREKIDVNSKEFERFEREFRYGRASGKGNNCLLSSIHQLFRGTDVEDDAAITGMRAGLVAMDHAVDGEMIDIYGGAGQQLANDMGVRIRVVQQTNNGLIVHPVLGQQGKVLTILHNVNHFTPLWPKELEE